MNNIEPKKPRYSNTWDVNTLLINLSQMQDTNLRSISHGRNAPRANYRLPLLRASIVRQFSNGDILWQDNMPHLWLQNLEQENYETSAYP